MGFASLLDIPLIGMDFGSTLAQSFIPAARVNPINAVVLAPILLFNYDRFDVKSMDWPSSGLMRRLFLAIRFPQLSRWPFWDCSWSIFSSYPASSSTVSSSGRGQPSEPQRSCMGRWS